MSRQVVNRHFEPMPHLQIYGPTNTTKGSVWWNERNAVVPEANFLCSRTWYGRRQRRVSTPPNTYDGILTFVRVILFLHKRFRLIGCVLELPLQSPYYAAAKVGVPRREADKKRWTIPTFSYAISFSVEKKAWILVKIVHSIDGAFCVKRNASHLAHSWKVAIRKGLGIGKPQRKLVRSRQEGSL